MCDTAFLHVFFCCWSLHLRNLLVLPVDTTKVSHPGSMADLPMSHHTPLPAEIFPRPCQSVVDTMFIWRLVFSLAGDCHTNCFVITTWSQAGFAQIPLLTPAFACPGSLRVSVCWGAHLLLSICIPGDGAFFPACPDRICPFNFASWSL